MVWLAVCQVNFGLYTFPEGKRGAGPGTVKAMTGQDWQRQRQEMVAQQVRARGVLDESVLQALLTVPRERFVPTDARASAYEDRPLPIGLGQTISQPYIVAYMSAQLAVTPTSRILEIGTGSGYQTAILAHLGAVVFSVERHAELQAQASKCLQTCRLPAEVHLKVGDGSVGWPESAPYDRVIVTAAAPRVPSTLLQQLAEGGVLVAPVGGAHTQTLVRVVRQAGRTVETPLIGCRFVRLFGEEGWRAEDGCV